MAIKTYRPYTPSRRAMTTSAYSEITKTTPEKSLLAPMKKTGGRNNQGKITCRHIGGGNKTRYRIIDFKRRKDGIPATVKAIEYRLALLRRWSKGLHHRTAKPSCRKRDRLR